MVAQGFKALLAVMCLVSTPALASGDKLKTPKKALESLEGESRFSGDLSGREITAVQFWASWCTGCATVMADISQLLSTRQDIGYVTVSLDESRDVALKFFANKSEIVRSNLKRSYLDPSGGLFAEAMGVESLPYLIFVRKDGTIVKRIKGHPSKSDLDFLTKKG